MAEKLVCKKAVSKEQLVQPANHDLHLTQKKGALVRVVSSEVLDHEHIYFVVSPDRAGDQKLVATLAW